MADSIEPERPESGASDSLHSNPEDSHAPDKMQQPLLTNRMKRKRMMQQTLGFILANWYKLAILGIIIALIVLVSVKGFSIFGKILHWFERRNTWGGWGIFIGMFTGLIALFVPGIVLITAAGYVFGFWKGLLAVWIGGSVGQALAFLLARYLLHDWVENFVTARWPKWKYIDAVLEREGWKIVFLLRLSPIIPYNVLNIGLATTSMHFLQFAIVSSVGIIPELAVFVYFGTLADNIGSIISGDTGPGKAWKWVLLGFSLVFVVAGAVVVKIVVSRAIKQAEELHNRSEIDLALAAGDVESPTGGASEGQPLLSSLPREGPFANSSSMSPRMSGGINTNSSHLSNGAEANDINNNHSFELKTMSTPPPTPPPPTTGGSSLVERAGAALPLTALLPGKVVTKPSLSTPLHVRTSSKAKMSPKATDALKQTPFTDRGLKGQESRDLEIGAPPGSATSSRRRLIHSDSEDLNP